MNGGGVGNRQGGRVRRRGCGCCAGSLAGQWKRPPGRLAAVLGMPPGWFGIGSARVGRYFFPGAEVGFAGLPRPWLSLKKTVFPWSASPATAPVFGSFQCRAAMKGSSKKLGCTERQGRERSGVVQWRYGRGGSGIREHGPPWAAAATAGGTGPPSRVWAAAFGKTAGRAASGIPMGSRGGSPGTTFLRKAGWHPYCNRTGGAPLDGAVTFRGGIVRPPRHGDEQVSMPAASNRFARGFPGMPETGGDPAPRTVRNFREPPADGGWWTAPWHFGQPCFHARPHPVQ